MQTTALKALTPEQIQAIAAVLANRPVVAMSAPNLLAKKAQRGMLEPEIVPIDAAPIMLVAQLFNDPDKARQQPVSTAGRMTVPGRKQRIEPVMPLCGSNVPPPSS